MDIALLTGNLLSAPILFFSLGAAAGLLKSDLAIPEPVTKLLSLYLLWAIGLKGGVQIASSSLSGEVVAALGAGVVFACMVPVYVFFLLRKGLGTDNAAAISSVYGSVSAVTFLTATTYLTRLEEPFGGHMVAALALMESPAIILALLMRQRYAHARSESSEAHRVSNPGSGLAHSLKEAALNGPVVLLTGSMVIGAIMGKEGFATIKPLASDVFQGVLVFFLLELGLLAARKSRTLRVVGWRLVAFAIVVPIVNALAAMCVARALELNRGDALLLVMLAGSASYIAAPAVMRTAIPRASPGVYVPLALAVTFPFNVAIGLPVYWAIIREWWAA